MALQHLKNMISHLKHTKTSLVVSNTKSAGHIFLAFSPRIYLGKDDSNLTFAYFSDGSETNHRRGGSPTRQAGAYQVTWMRRKDAVGIF